MSEVSYVYTLCGGFYESIFRTTFHFFGCHRVGAISGCIYYYEYTSNEWENDWECDYESPYKVGDD